METIKYTENTKTVVEPERGKTGSKWNLTVSTTYLVPPANYRSKKDPMKALGRIDFTKYAQSTIIYLVQTSKNG